MAGRTVQYPMMRTSRTMEHRHVLEHKKTHRHKNDLDNNKNRIAGPVRPREQVQRNVGEKTDRRARADR